MPIKKEKVEIVEDENGDLVEEVEVITENEEPADEPTEEKNDLSSKTVAELRSMAKEAGIKGFSTMKKDELISSLSE